MYEAEFVQMVVHGEALTSADGDGDDGAFPPTLFTFAKGDFVFGVPWLHIEDEFTLTRRLHTISTDWTISLLTNKATGLKLRLATDATAFSYDDLLTAETSRLRAAAAKRAKDEVLGLRKKKQKKEHQAKKTKTKQKRCMRKKKRCKE